MRKFTLVISILALIGGLATAPLSAQAATAEDLLAQINKLAPAERQKRLEEGAKKEGNVVVYSNHGLETSRANAQGSTTKYPLIKGERTRLQGAKGLDRILLEHRVGKLTADVVGVDFDNIGELVKAGVLGRYDSPEKKYYSNQFWDKDGRWYVGEYTLVVIGYNTNLVKTAEATKSYADLLNPKWKGDISIDTEPEQAVFAWLLEWGDEKTAEYMKALMRNGTVARRGHTLQVQLLCSGEIKIAAEVYPLRVAQMKRAKKCPVDMVSPNPTAGSLGSRPGSHQSASHPHGGAL